VTRHGPGEKPGLRGGLILAAVYATPALLAGIVASLAGFYPTGIFMVVLCVVAMVVASNLFAEHGVGFVIGGVLACLAAILAILWVPMAVLSIRGQPMTATVTAEHVIHGRGTVYQYELRDREGRRIPGKLTEIDDDRYDPGDVADVVVDPMSLVDPQAAGEPDASSGVGMAAAGALALTIAVSIATGARTPMEELDLRFSRYKARH
jgi:hypothetical protein